MMDNREDSLHKPNNLKGRLKLKKDDKESTDNKAYLSDDCNNECEKNGSTCTSQTSCEDDSILDFKSPKKYMLRKNINSNKLLDKPKKKVPNTKIKIVNNKKKPDHHRSLQSKKNLHDIQQPLIESSFFKTENNVDSPQGRAANVKTAYVCPLCFKNLKDESSQAVHMKSCAMKNNISTKKLLDAVELQERQAAERKSLGLLSAPVLQDKKKPVPRKAARDDDPDLQLALALSKSLYEKEEIEILDEAEIIAISSSPSLPDNNKEGFQRTTLQNFGFTSNRSVSPTNNYPTNRIKRRKFIEPTILQRRTIAERERILTERIAEILMGYKDFTQKVQGEDEQPINVKERIVLKSQFLQQLRRTENTLWNRTRLTPNQNVFYVAQLSPQITPLLKKEDVLNEEENVTKLTDHSDKESLTKGPQEIKKMQTANIIDSNEKLTISRSVEACCEKRRFLDTLAIDWRNILNDSSASDIIMLVKNGKHIWVHKLVFYVRCTNILLDVITNDTEFSTVKEKICWIDIDYDVALAFLEFIYCGTIDRHSNALDSDTLLFAVRSLARKYKVNDLFVYLRQKKFETNLAEAEREESTENVIESAKEALNASDESGKLTCNATPNHTHDELKSTECVEKIPLQEDVSDYRDKFQSLRNSYVLAEDSCTLEDNGAVSINSLEQINSRNITSTNLRGASISPDIFDDTPDVTKYKSATRSTDHEDSNIHMLFSLIKQDADISICSQKLSTKETDDAKHSERMSGESISTRLKNEEQDIMEIDSDSDLNSSKPFVDPCEDKKLMDTPQSSKSKAIQERLSNVAREKGDLTLFIEKRRRENARSNSDVDSDSDITIRPEKMSRIRHSNPFHVYKWDDKAAQSDNLKQSNKTRKKFGKLSIIEQRMRSFADKNPEFYSDFSNERATDIKRTDSSPASSPKRKSPRDNPENYSQLNIAPVEEDVDISDRVTITPLSKVHSPCIGMMNKSISESICNLEADEKEDEISMYSKYIRNHHDNSIAKYRTAIERNMSDSDLSGESMLSNTRKEESDTMEEDDAALTQFFLMQEVADVVVSSDTEVESISSDVNCSVILHDDSNYKDHVQLSRKTTKDNKQDTESENQPLVIEETAKATTTDLEEQKDINSTILSDRTKFNINNRSVTADNEDVKLDMIFTRTKSGLNESNRDKIDNHEEKAIPSPIMVSSSPDLRNTENSFSSREDCDEYVAEAGSRKSRKSTGFAFNFEDDIYLANVDVDKYEEHHVLERSKSTDILNVTEFKKGNSCRCSNKSNRENITDSRKITSGVIHCEKLDRSAMFLTRSITSVRKFQKKSLSEGQININRLQNQDMPKHASVQFQYNQNIENIKAVPKIIDKDVTPPPDYDGMKTPELHREMKRYGLKAQKRCRAVKLLKHIYNELHPLIPINEISTEQEIAEVSSDEEGPPAKRPNTNDSSVEKSNSTEESDDELLCSQDSVNSIKSTISKEMEFYETESLPALENSTDIREAFTRLINVDKDLHNKILRYEPVNIEQLHSTLRSRGFKCKLSNFMNFLDEQCITFYVPEQSVRSRTRRKA
ncbi:PREDICTED: uncharacterized protein LOC106749241 isoform X2 [Dinoponera quadriceps]|uniref:Structure-specific endonuclease subunit SLX4 n=1 Tax=Dinoponera quadriceps TaxID=609295 RepID=A0A6P3XZP0_DINQU|nr:PREDICTED: uncharacterized protein LOC106749241 isoform X2 [Dinoponera quadriceps]